MNHTLVLLDTVLIIGYELVFSPFLIFVMNQTQTKCFPLFVFLIIQVYVLYPVNTKFFFWKRFLKQNLLYSFLGIVFQTINKIYSFLAPRSKLKIVIVVFVEN